MKNRFFDYDLFRRELIDDPEKRDLIEKYETKYGVQSDAPLEKHPFYKDYLSRFEIDWDVVPPEGIDISPHECSLLVRLVLGSFSSHYMLSLDEAWKKNPIGKVRANLGIMVTNEDNSVTRTLDELWSFQVKRLFEIYVNEQIHLVDLQNESDDDEEIDERSVIEKEKEMRIELYNKKKKDLLAEAESLRNRQAVMPWLFTPKNSDD